MIKRLIVKKKGKIVKMGIIFDLILILILGSCIFVGYKKGLVNVIFKVFAFLVALIITFILYKPITNLIVNHTQIDEKIESVIIENATKEVENTENNADEQVTVNEYVQKYVQNTGTEIQNNLVESVAEPIAYNVVSIGVGIVLFVVARIALILLNFITDTLAELPIIKQCNEIGGIVYGFLKGLLIIYILLAILFFIISINNNITLNEAIDSSFLTKILYAHNLILNIIM